MDNPIMHFLEWGLVIWLLLFVVRAVSRAQARGKTQNDEELPSAQPMIAAQVSKPAVRIPSQGTVKPRETTAEEKNNDLNTKRTSEVVNVRSHGRLLRCEVFSAEGDESPYTVICPIGRRGQPLDEPYRQKGGLREVIEVLLK